MKKGKLNTSLILSALALTIPMGNAFAQDEDPLLTESADAVVNTSQIDIEGMYNTQNQNPKKKKVTEADRLQQFRRDLEEKHEQMMRKKVEDMRLEEERKLARKLQSALSGQMQAMDQVTTKASAPAKTEAVVEAPAVKEQFNNSISLGGGFLNIGTEANELEASMNIRLGMDSLVHPRVSVGVGIRYMAFDTADVDNIYASNLYNGNSYYYPNANNNFNNNEARNIEYRQISFDVNTKIFLTVDSKIRPFIGGALAYNRGSYKYEKNDNYTIGQYSYGDEKVSSSNVSGSGMIGAQVKFTEQIAAEVNVSFEKAFTSGVSELSSDDTPDEARLRNLALDLEEANIVGINLGLSVSF